MQHIKANVTNKSMKQNIVALFIISIFVCSCISNNKQLLSLPVSVRLQADSIIVPPVILSATRLFIAHDMLVIYEQQKDTMFSFWKLPQCLYEFSAGKKGEGPNEFLQLDRVFVETVNGFKTFELSSNKIKDLKIDFKDDGNGKLELLAVKRLTIDQIPLNRFTFLSDSSYCFLSNNEDYEYTLLDKKGNSHLFSPYPNLLYKKSDEINTFLYNKLLVGKPDGDKFASFYAYIKMMKIYDNEGNVLKELLMEEPTNLDNGDNRFAYYSTFPYATNDHIYVMTNEDDSSKVLQVWSWEGIPLSQCILDKSVDAFAVSEKYKRLYAIDNERDNVIYVYKLDNIVGD